MPKKPKQNLNRRLTWWKRIVYAALLGLGGAYVCLLLLLAAYRFIDPPVTAVQLERRLEAIGRPGKFVERKDPVPLSRISSNLQHAVIAAEDGNFYRHFGFDFQQIEIAIREDLLEEGRLRGASTISQQLVKNLFFTTRGSYFRKAAEVAVVPAAEVILGKQRILELYLNNVEFGPGVYGAEAAARYHYRIPASRLSREQSARLAAILPAPRRRRPAAMNRYSTIILRRMEVLGW